MRRLVVLLTGGIGSGKTTVSDQFARLGVDVVDSDVAARMIMTPDQPAFAAVRERFGNAVVLPDGTLDRARLRAIVFADGAQRRWLERLTHPLIGIELRRGIDASRPPYCLLVVPLFVPGRRHPLADRVLLVDTPEHVQLSRTMARDSNNEDQVKSIMAAQATRQQRIDGADDVIANDGEIADLAVHVRALDAKYRQIALAPAIEAAART